MGAFPVRRHRPGIIFFLRKLRLEGGGVSCFSRDFEIYCLNCPKSVKIGLGGVLDSQRDTCLEGNHRNLSELKRYRKSTN